MATHRSKWLTLLGSVIISAASAAYAQDSGPLLDLLVKKGVVNNQEAEELRAELARDASAAVVSTISGGKSTVGLSLSGRIQVQYVNLATDIDGTTADPVTNNHFFLRRVYLGAKANLGKGFSANFNYDFAGSTFDAAFAQWRMDDRLMIDIGFRKVPIGLEEWYTSSGSLKAIERSPLTRFFVEGNNGRRLGAGSYRQGVYVGGKLPSGLFYNVAVTNPERDESAAGVTSTGSSANNNMSYWANVGYTGSVSEGAFKYTVSSSVGVLPDQGSKTLGTGHDLTVYNAFADLTAGPIDLQLEYMGSKNEQGVSATRDSKSKGYSGQIAYQVIEPLELVSRYTYVDSDGRGLTTSDLIRSAPSGGTMDKLTEWYFGFNYFFRGHDAKWQLGYILGESKDALSGAQAKAKTTGVRSQFQVNF